MDITFSESENYYSSSVSTSPLQGETWKEEHKWWDCPVIAPTVTERDAVVIERDVMGVVDLPADIAVTTTPVVERDDTVDHVAITETDVVGIVTTDDATVPENLEHHTPSRQTPLLLIPDNDNSSPENIHKVTSPSPPPNHVLDTPVGYQLPARHNRGKPPARYPPSTEGKQSQYPISNHVTT
jgi:hypothetical protein